jgi:SPP1 gp7 family putative phage head morphogenesis protein
MISLLAKAKPPKDTLNRQAWEDYAIEVLRRAFGEQADRIQSLLEERPDESSPEYRTWLQRYQETWRLEPSTLARQVLPLFDDLAVAGAAEGIAMLPIAVDWDLVNDAVLSLATERANAFAANVSQTGEAQAARIIADWIKTGGTIPELVDRVERIWPESRAERGAVTIVTEVYAHGNRAAWEASGVVPRYRWNTAADKMVCPICGPRNAQEFEIGATASLPPAHAGCRCWITPVVLTPQEWEAQA